MSYDEQFIPQNYGYKPLIIADTKNLPYSVLHINIADVDNMDNVKGRQLAVTSVGA